MFKVGNYQLVHTARVKYLNTCIYEGIGPTPLVVGIHDPRSVCCAKQASLAALPC